LAAGQCAQAPQQHIAKGTGCADSLGLTDHAVRWTRQTLPWVGGEVVTGCAEGAGHEVLAGQAIRETVQAY
jgi:hypothetical protein